MLGVDSSIGSYTADCVMCGTQFKVFNSELRKKIKRNLAPSKYCTLACRNAAYKGAGNPNFRGGVLVKEYRLVLMPEHPYANKKGYVMEHRLIMERMLGRYLLPEEQVHHKNHDKHDNRPSNLQLMANVAEHRREHGEYRITLCPECGIAVRRSAGHRRRWKVGYCSRYCLAIANLRRINEGST